MKTILVYTLRVNASYNELFLSLLREGRRRGWRFAWVDPDEREDPAAERERLARVFALIKPDGFVGGYVGNDTPVIPPAGTTSVWVDTSQAPPGATLVRHDNASFGRAAADVLLPDGRTFAVLGMKRHQWSSIRERVFAERVRAAGRRCRVLRFRADSAHPFAALGDVRVALSRLPRPVSVFAVSDRLASMALMAAESLGWHCPRDIRIVGVDDDEILCMSFPTPISSVHPDWALGGRLVAKALEAQMRGEPPGREYVYGAAGVTRRATTRSARARPKDPRVERALAFIAADYASPITVGDVTDAMGYSRSHGELRFREETGRTILETIEEMRWERLVVLLGRHNASLAALPDMCGFRSASALRQFFRRRTGMSMTEWRNMQNRRNIFQTK